MEPRLNEIALIIILLAIVFAIIYVALAWVDQPAIN